jgi:hypothetical protein
MTTAIVEDRWVRRASVLVPREIREFFLADLLAERAERRARGGSRLRTDISSLRELLDGIAQHAPLRPRLPEAQAEQPAIAARAALFGWCAWRVTGACLFLGHMLGYGKFFVLGLFVL